MIVLTLQGGLGNQLFQYAAGYAAARQRSVLLKLDLTGYGILGRDRRKPSTSDRTPDILDFAIAADTAEVEEVETVRLYQSDRVARRLRQIKYKYLVNYYIDFHGGPLRPDRGNHMEGYFQTDRYFSGIASEIVAQFQLRDDAPIAAATERLRHLDVPVSIHVRRGDFVGTERNRRLLDVCGTAYYGNAASAMQTSVGAFTPVVFSDDVDWVKANMDFGQPAYFPAIDGKLTAAQEMVLMSRCSHHIIANSTFSWWGAYLNRSTARVVVGPSAWTRGLPGYKHIMPSGWKRVPVDRYPEV